KSSTPQPEVNLTDSIYASRYCDELPRARRLYRVLSLLQTTKVCSSERKIREKFLSQRSLVTLVQGDSARARHFFLDITFYCLYTFNQLQQKTVAIHEKWKGRIDSGRNRSCNRSQAWAQSFRRPHSRLHFLLSISLPAAAVHFGS